MPAERRTRILIVDDSAVMRSLLRSVVSTDNRLESAGTAADGSQALSCLDAVRPDLILLDVEMPVMNGLVTLKQLRARGCKVPVIMCSSLTQRGAQVTIEALASGASDYVGKPRGQSGREEAIRTLASELIPKIHALTSRREPQKQTLIPAAPRATVPFPAAPGPGAAAFPQTCAAPQVVAIGVSTRGPAALEALLPALPANFPLPVLIVQHMPELFTGLLAERLNSRCRLRVCEGAEAMPVSPGSIYIARGNWHMEVTPAVAAGSCPKLHLSQGPLENYCRPAVDAMFRSVVHAYGGAVLAVLLTGMGSDGLNGSRMIRQQGGCVLAQDEATSIVWGMPGAVAQAGVANRVLPLQAIAPEILKRVAQAPSQGELGETRGRETRTSGTRRLVI
jgi:two-component system chemotaxis response regulator CheB